MGKGKGAPEYWVAVIKPGRVIYEMDGVTERWPARPSGSPRFPLATRFVQRKEAAA